MRNLTTKVLMDLPEGHRYHSATVDAVRHAARHLRVSVSADVVSTDAGSLKATLKSADAIIIGPGSPYRNADAVFEIIGEAREGGIPLLGT